jgi:flagellar hook protein FlgE
MDVEGNNIANVNTTGFKYSRVDFADLLSQTSKIATAPQDKLGGKNPMQVGLGSQVGSITKIFKQGSVQTTDRNTDMAIQGDGFFIVSSDGGSTYKYTRNGAFSFDANGNFVDNNGYIVQGWLRDPDTGFIDSTAPIQNIKIPPGLTTPAKASTIVTLKANLNSGDTIVNKTPIYRLDSNHNWVDKNEDGIQTSDEIHTENDTNDVIFDLDENVYEQGQDFGSLFNANGEAFALQDGQGIWVSATDAVNEQTIDTTASKFHVILNGVEINVDLSGTEEEKMAQIVNAINEHSIETGINASSTSNTLTLINDNQSGTEASSKNIKLEVQSDDDTSLNSVSVITAYQYVYKKTPISYTPPSDDSSKQFFHTTEDLRNAIQTNFRLHTDYSGDGTIDSTDKNDGVEVTINEEGKFQITNPAGDAFNSDDGDEIVADGTDDDGDGNDTNQADTDINDWDLSIAVTALTDATNDISANTKFTDTFSALQGNLPLGSGVRTSQQITAASHAASIDIFDSLGTKHTVRFEFVKIGYTDDGGTEWQMKISVPKPGDINGGIEPKNIVMGSVKFNSDGSLQNYSPTSITFTANNGSTPNQNINIDLGKFGDFDGMTSFDNPSTTSGISQDGYPGGDLNGIRIDETGTIIGSFTNGRSFGLAKVAMANFANNEGLESDGGNTFIQTSNSGDPIIGAAATGKRGFVQASSLEMSNVDLSRSLTQLIIVQRGFQANSKTITTSDQMLQTLLQLKQ